MLQAIKEYFVNNTGEYFAYIGQHLFISLLALAIAILIGFSLGYLSYKNKHLRKIALSFTNLMRIVPSLALLFLFVPILGVGFVPALVALVILGTPSVLINTVVGMDQVETSYKEVAKGMGMNPKEIRNKIVLPLALPQILSGIKIALVEIISSATLAAYIGADGLGVLIFTGLQMRRMDFVIIGGVTVALIAFLITLIFDLLIYRMNYRIGGQYE